MAPRAAVVLAALVAGALAPTAPATHGDFVSYTSELPAFEAAAVYCGGGGGPCWHFVVVEAGTLVDQCRRVYGTVEVGFNTTCDSGTRLTIGGTRHYHGYPNLPPGDVHTGIPVVYGELQVTAVMVTT